MTPQEQTQLYTNAGKVASDTIAQFIGAMISTKTLPAYDSLEALAKDHAKAVSVLREELAKQPAKSKVIS